jgi:hypothetical protein
MKNIPVTFELNGKEYKGQLSRVAGAASTAMYYLTVDKLHYGQLWYVSGHTGFEGGVHTVAAGWRFASNSHPELDKLADYFGYCVEAWDDCNSDSSL